jgi:hypothetical protein
LFFNEVLTVPFVVGLTIIGVGLVVLSMG